jgi:receptor-binding and translocation channel-forming TcA subunit of Tc toxin
MSSGLLAGSGAASSATALVRSRTDIAPASALVSTGPGGSDGVAMPIAAPDTATAPIFKYTFEIFFHPYIGELIAQVNRRSLSGLLDPVYQAGLTTKGFFVASYTPRVSSTVTFGAYPEKMIDVTMGGPYANYNWELCFHFPLAVAVHLSKNQRFAEAQRWFHYIFDPTCNDTSVAPPQRFWKFLAFRDPAVPLGIAELLAMLADPATDPARKARILAAYDAIKAHPFEPHAVARSRIAAYQYAVVMKYLDNLIAWGDSLFVQDTIESINEATQRYVLAANILGPRPQQSPARGESRPRTFADLEATADPTGNALVDLEGQFPFDFPAPSLASPAVGPLFGIGRTLYFCVPRNDKLLAYWDTVGDRLFKIRHSMNIDGVAQQLPLFDPPIDPGLLVKAAAAGIDVAAALDASNQPIGPVRAPSMIQKAAELAAEVRSLGGALLSALEKGDAEHLARLRQGQEIKLLQLTQDTRFLQWKQAEAATESLLRTRESALERYRYYQRLLGRVPDGAAVPPAFLRDRPELTEKNFDEMFGNLVSQYAGPIRIQPYPPLQLAGGTSPANQSGATGTGSFYLNTNEDAELNTHLPAARDTRVLASATELLAQVFSFIPDFSVNLEFWGLGGTAVVFGGSKLAASAHAVGEVLRINSAWEQDQAGLASRTAGYQRRAEEWTFQSNLAARELMQIGRQLVGSLIAEQVARHEYQAVQTQIENATQVDDFLATKFTGEQLYAYLSGELSRLYYAYYRFALDTARKAERTMKRELMRPELDATEYIQVNYWDSGRRGLMSGERLHLDVKRMELAYLDSNQRELEITRHVSIRQLDPLALLSLRVHGSCQITIPEWLYDRDCPGHYLRRIKTVALSLPAVVGPYASVNCSLTLLRSTIRRSPLLTQNKYARTGTDDPRFLDSFGAAQSIVTSSGTSDSGLFETNLRDDRFLPFEGAGAVSTWQLALPETFQPFDYSSLSDAILHIRYTARSGGAALAAQAVTEMTTIFAAGGTSALLFSLRHDFPGEWAAFMTGDSAPFTVTLQNTFFPYLAQTKKLTINSLELYDAALTRSVLAVALTGDINQGSARLQVPASDPVLTRTATQVFLIVRYSFTT